MKVNVLGRTTDLRTNTNVVYAQMTVRDYLALVGDDFDDFEIQRSRQKHKAYTRMKSDITVGAVLPSITLAVKPEYISTLLPVIDEKNHIQLEQLLAKPGMVNILDGLQRTFILKDLEKEGIQFLSGQKLLLEFWIEESLQHLIYRIIVLNAGQKPMSLRHQVELLFTTIKSKLETTIEGLQIYTERDASRRNVAKKYPLDRIVTAYTSFLTKSAETKRENIIAQQLIESEIMDSSEEELNRTYNAFERYLAVYSHLDTEVYRVYNEANGNKNWLATENVMNSFFAALSDFGSTPSRVDRINAALDNLLRTLRGSGADSDPLGLDRFKSLVDGFNPRKMSIGYSTRRLLTNGFKEYFREEGERSLEECWIMEAE